MLNGFVECVSCGEDGGMGQVDHPRVTGAARADAVRPFKRREENN